MSYILEALKKAEHQREIGRVPHIDSEHEPATAGVSSRWGMIVVLILLINAGLLLVLFWPNGSPGVPEPVAQRTDPSGTAPSSVAPTSAPHPREATPTNSYMPVPAPIPETPQQAAPVPIPRSAAIQPTIPPVTAHVSPPPRPAPVPVTAPPQYARQLPVWPQVPVSIFQRLSGGLRLDVHVYSDKPRDRFVLINLQKYHEGEQLQEGPVVDEITVDGVVLSLQGQQFLVRSQ